ncbi:MAG: RNA 2',3'-cyclic phosphodiesterase [Chlamydiae bacterium]|nr:RNA 2',3'-cyclic phosphodiesterase [Chlamydiota bacterium]
MQDMNKHLFFAYSIDAPWPSQYPEGRILAEEVRHDTFAFLGSQDFAPLEEALSTFPIPDMIGPVGRTTPYLFLPEKSPRVVAYGIDWLEKKEKLTAFEQKVEEWLKQKNYPVDPRPRLPHLTVARSPFDKDAWKEDYTPLPILITGIHLYESLGNLHYQSLWHRPLTPPFVEIEHTADIAYLIRGHNPQELFLHASIAISFSFPTLLPFLQERSPTDIQETVRALNEMVTLWDSAIGCPIKAVSYHGAFEKKEELLEWEMIVDV